MAIGPQEASERRIPTLDGWRAVAILMVIAAHVRESVLPDQSANHLQLWLMGLGLKGVDIFFCLSGFLITSKLVSELSTTGDIRLSTFYLRRCFRILPAHYTYLLVLWLLTSVGLLAVPGMDFVSCLLFFRNYWLGKHYTGHFWSLAIEEQFYFVWPLLLLLLGTSRARWTAFVLALGIETWRWFDETYHMSTSLTRLYGNQFLTDHRADSLLWGCVLALFFPYLRQKISVRAASVAAVAAPCVAVAFFAIHMPLVYFWQPFLITSAIAATVLSPAGWVGRLLELRILTTIGIGSYSLYLWQQLFLPVFAAGRPLGLVQQTPFNLVCIAVAAYLSYRFVEQPLIRFGRQLTRRQHDPSPQAISATTAGAN